MVQKYFVDYFMASGMFKTPSASLQNQNTGGLHSHADCPCAFASGEDPDLPGHFAYDPVSGFEWVPRYVMAVGDISQGVLYGQLSRAYDAMKAAKSSANANDKAHYELLMGTIAYSLK